MTGHSIAGAINMTPETDKAQRMAYAQEYMVPTDFARKLERERDEAMDTAQKSKAYKRVLKETNARLERERDKWAKLCGQYKQERDEARKAARRYLTELKNNGH